MRQQFAVMKGEEEGVERARKALEEETGEDEYSDEEPSEELHRSDYATDFFNFGNSLTVQGKKYDQ